MQPSTIVMIGQKGLATRSGGIERHVELIATGMAARGYRIVVYGRRWYVGNAKAPTGVEQRFTPGIHTKHLDAITHSVTALWDARKIRPQIVHLQGSSVALLAPLARILHPRAKIVVTFHCIDAEHSKWSWMAKKILRLGEWIACKVPHRTIVVSQTLLRDCLERFACQGAYISHPLDVQKNEVPTTSLADHDLVKDQYLLFVGRLIAHKQPHLLIQAYAKARAAKPELFQNIPLIIVGAASWTDSYVKWLYQLASSVSGVRLLGERCGMELAAIQAHAMAHVFPTQSEGLAFAMLEAGAFARPAIMTALPQNREALGTSAIQVRMNDVDDLAEGLISMVSLPLAEREAMGLATRAHVEKTYRSLDRLDDLDRFYREVLGQSVELTSSALQARNAS